MRQQVVYVVGRVFFSGLTMILLGIKKSSSHNISPIKYIKFNWAIMGWIRLVSFALVLRYLRTALRFYSNRLMATIYLDPLNDWGSQLMGRHMRRLSGSRQGSRRHRHLFSAGSTQVRHDFSPYLCGASLSVNLF